LHKPAHSRRGNRTTKKGRDIVLLNKIFKCPQLDIIISKNGCEYSQNMGHYYCAKCEYFDTMIKTTNEHHPTKYTALLLAILKSAIDTYQTDINLARKKYRYWSHPKRRSCRTYKQRTLFKQDFLFCLETMKDIKHAREWLESDSKEPRSLVWVCEHLRRMAGEHGASMTLDPHELRERLGLDEECRH